MLGQRSTHWTTGLWLLLCAGLAANVALELSEQLAPQVTAALPAVPLPESAPEAELFEPPPRHAFAEITARPLFSDSRRPFAVDSRPEEDTAVEKIAIELIGTLVTEQLKEQDLQMAILQSVARDLAQRLGAAEAELKRSVSENEQLSAALGALRMRTQSALVLAHLDAAPIEAQMDSVPDRPDQRAELLYAKNSVDVAPTMPHPKPSPASERGRGLGASFGHVRP